MNEFKPKINFGAEGAPGGPSTENKVIQNGQEDLARLMGERAGIYPMEGSDVVELLLEAEIKEKGDVRELEVAIKETLAYKEGLKFGLAREIYFRKGNEERNEKGNEEESSVIYLQNLFTSVEGAISRPRSPYIEPALEEAIGRKIRESGRYESNQGGWRLRQKGKYKKINRERYLRGIELIPDEKIDANIDYSETQLKNCSEALPVLRRLENHIESRKIVDAAFIQRMVTCEDPQGATEIAKRYGTAISPDKGHWKAFFQEEATKESGWGKKVNKVFWRIVAFGLPDDVVKEIGMDEIPQDIRTNEEKPGENVGRNIYAGGFERTKQFKNWILCLLDDAEGDMDAVWAAWRVALLWEVPNELGLNIEIDEKTKEIKNWNIPFPPIGSSLSSFSAHLGAKREYEFGMKPDGSIDEGRADRFVSHSGLPMSLSVFPSLCKSFLHESVCKFSSNEIMRRKEQMEKLSKNLPIEKSDSYFSNMHEADKKHITLKYKKMKEDIDWILDKAKTEDGRNEMEKSKKTVEISLWEIGLFAQVGFESEDFPWMYIEESLEGEEAGEIAPGGFGSWLLRKTRSWAVIKDIRSRPSYSEIASPDYFNDESRLRNWSKVLGTLKTDPSQPGYIEPIDNPRAWWLAGILWYHTAGRGASCPLIKDKPYRDYRTTTRAEEIEPKRESAELRNSGHGDIFRHATNSGFLREIDIDWIKKGLKIKII